MDNFDRTENIEVFRRWVYFQVKRDSRLTLEEYDLRTYKIYYKDRVARFVIWPIGVIEEAINEGDDLLFYLHYQFYNFHFATDLFHRMIDKLTEDVDKSEKSILLCCTGGLTTGYFAEEINKYCKINHIQLKVKAAAVFSLANIYKEYDLIMVAPQLKYKVIEMTQQYKPTPVLGIDSTVFATYDCQGLLKQIEEYYRGK